MQRFNRVSTEPPKVKDPGDDAVSRAPEIICGLNTLQLMGVFVACLMGLFSVSVILRDLPSYCISVGAEARVLQVKPQKEGLRSEDDSSQPVEVPKDKLLGGLLAAGFDERSCLSRYQSVLYGKALIREPSSYLISRLRSYEALHKRCGPFTGSYNKTVELLKSGQQIGPSDCNYLVWISIAGLGNRILTLASAFLYALLTNRVLLVYHGADMTNLFCEPFPEVSWLIPTDFPLTSQFSGFNRKSVHSHGNMLKNNSSQIAVSPFLYLHLVHDYNNLDKLFFCDEYQTPIQQVPWLIMKSNNYFIPSLFLIPSFEEELRNLFPEMETVFHFLGRYLFHPTNQAWGLITRYYEAYLAKADEKIGIQIRVFEKGNTPYHQHILDQILACTLKENLLPEINPKKHIITPPGKNNTKAVLLTSLNSEYSEKLRDMYWEHPTVTGDIIGVYQPSHEGHQKFDNHMQNVKAWAEMYLLSLTDKLVTSPWSTFGYVAQGLGGLKPWILVKPVNEMAPDPPCQRAMSMEPCFHAAPCFDCKNMRGTDTGLLVPHVRHCEDVSLGLKLVDRKN
ncbi:galactoside 2-alpha-L-fucosyltransferase-like [Actinidia eriantha]|uniref:galactoside 2-alpha-L-fucosyltransferase-like n=1 Tax=Actinidia eriantha TaxID=165200 RepID=UPI002588AA09|nr:galactoside 2-alpha-L-fucosyltransferase-like [Actinidia eriantha]